MKNYDTEKRALIARKDFAVSTLFKEVDSMFEIIKIELEKDCSLKTMRYMLIIDVFLNELKDALNNYNNNEEEYDI